MEPHSFHSEHVQTTYEESILHFDDIPVEIITCVMESLYLGGYVEDIFTFRKVSKKTREAFSIFLRSNVKKHFLKGKKHSTPCIYFEQIKGLLALKRSTSPSTLLQINTGYGKTLLALFEAERCWKEKGWKTMIVIHHKALTTWLDEFKKQGYKIIGTRAHESDILVYHSKCNHHKKYVVDHYHEETIRQLPHYILLTTTTYVEYPEPISMINIMEQNIISKEKNYGNKDSVNEDNNIIQKDDSDNAKDNDVEIKDDSICKYTLHRNFDQVIVDDAHNLDYSEFWDCYKLFKKIIYLSAYDLPNITKNPTIVCQEKFDFRNQEDGLNAVKMEWEMFAKDSNSWTTIDILENILLKIQDRKTSSTPSKIVLFTMWSSQVLSSNIESFRTHLPGWEWHRFYDTSLGSLEKWRKSNHPSILVTSISSASESANFDVADAGIYLDFNCYFLNTARQAFGRLRRKSNPNKVIKNYLIYNPVGYVSEITTRIKAEYATNMYLSFKSKKRQRLIRIKKSMLKDGIYPLRLNKADFIRCFCDTSAKNPLPFKEEEHELSLIQILNYTNITI
jgi:hypothetical protein